MFQIEPVKHAAGKASMKSFPSTPLAPERRDLTDPRSTAAPSKPGRKPLNDRRSTP